MKIKPDFTLRESVCQDRIRKTAREKGGKWQIRRARGREGMAERERSNETKLYIGVVSVEGPGARL